MPIDQLATVAAIIAGVIAGVAVFAYAVAVYLAPPSANSFDLDDDELRRVA